MIKLNNLEQFLVSNILLTEAARIDHAEDLIFWEGSKGAIRSIKSFIDLESDGYKNVTMKWDGSPAVIFGRNDEGKFVLTDKSGFVAKGYNGKPTSPEELQQMFLNRGKSVKTDEYRLFVQEMKNIFSTFESAVPTTFRGYFKGDLLYFKTPLIENGRYVFKPNIVTYAVDVNSELGKKINQSKASVVVHREVDSFGNETTITNYNVFQGKQLLVIPPISVNNPPNVNEKRLKDIILYINKHARNIDDFINPSKLASMKMTNFPDVLYKYLNSKVDTGLVNIGDDFLQWISQSNLTDVMKKKITDYVNNNKNGFDSLWKVVVEIMSVKDEIINQIDNQDSEIKSYIGNEPGGEGYVFSHPEGDIKYVSRSKFSAANRVAHKQTIAEGGNAVAANSDLPREHLDSTIKNGLKIWNLDSLNYEIIGNKSKPVLGDIDVAVSTEQLNQLFGVNYDYDKKMFYDKLKQHAEANTPATVPTPTFKINTGLDQLHLNVPIIDENGNPVKSNEIPNEDGYVQIDLMIGDLNFMVKSLSGAPDSKYKAALRNILLMNIMSNSYESTEDPNKMTRYQMNWKKGLQSADVITNEKGKQEKQNIKTVYTDMDDVAEFLFGNNVTFNDINTLEKLIKLVKGNTFRYKNKRTEILNDFKKELERLKIKL